MAAVVAPISAIPTETPSKKAASALKDMSLNTPMKPTKLNFDEQVDETPAPAPKPDLAALRKRFVGDVDLDEKDEPLLKESKNRFVLFPIQYHEVSIQPRARLLPVLTDSIDLADV